MIEAVDIGIITAILGKLGWDERNRRKNGGSNGTTGKMAQRLTAVETTLGGLTLTIDKGVEALRRDLAEARESRNDLHDRCTKNEVAIGKLEGRLQGET